MQNKITELPRQKHKCSVCEQMFIWVDQSKWYGRVDDKDLSNLHKVCSDACFSKSKYKDKK